FSDSAIEAQLKYLLDREAELQLQIDELIEEITQLEAKITNKDGQDERGKSVEGGDKAGNNGILPCFNINGKDPPGCKHSISSDVIFSERRGQSQKPEELYGMIEELVPNGMHAY
ncbi:4556_t:CDS:2, partial [Racocetra fulgida]